jgi:nitroreductase
VPKEDLLKIIKAASMAPSGGNQQNWHFIIIENKKIKEELRLAVEKAVEDLLAKVNSKKAYEEISSYSKYFTFFTAAPALICVIEKPYDSLITRLIEKYLPDRQAGTGAKRLSNSGIQSVSAAIENLLLAAHDLGYGTCWMTGPLIARESFNKLLKVNAPDQIAALIPIGIPDSEPGVPTRKPPEEIVTFLS